VIDGGAEPAHVVDELFELGFELGRPLKNELHVLEGHGVGHEAAIVFVDGFRAGVAFEDDELLFIDGLGDERARDEAAGVRLCVDNHAFERRYPNGGYGNRKPDPRRGRRAGPDAIQCVLHFDSFRSMACDCYMPDLDGVRRSCVPRLEPF
jgi:hypothetical protein